MNNDVRVELVRVQRPADPATVSQRVDLVERMEGMGMVDASTGEVNTGTTAWLARVNGVEFEVLDFALQQGDEAPVLNLVFPVAALSVNDGAPTTVSSPQHVDPPKPGSTWGAEGKPDPREAIPGWAPEVSA